MKVFGSLFSKSEWEFEGETLKVFCLASGSLKGLRETFTKKRKFPFLFWNYQILDRISATFALNAAARTAASRP